jgi:L-aspartate oxidase
LLEGLVFAKRAATAVLESEIARCSEQFPLIDEPLVLEGDKAKKDTLRRIMWEKVSIVRTRSGLEEAKTVIESMLAEPIGRMLKLRLLTAKSIVEAALSRNVSIGVHYINEERG